MANKKYTDEQEFIFQTFESSLIAEIATGKIDAQEIAANEMTNRGLDKDGEWVGFARAALIWGVK